MPRATRAQRAAAGGRIVPLTGSKRHPTAPQLYTIGQLRNTYGKAVKSVRQPDSHTGHVCVVMDTALGDTYWIVDLAGQIIRRYEPQPLFTDGDDAS